MAVKRTVFQARILLKQRQSNAKLAPAHSGSGKCSMSMITRRFHGYTVTLTIKTLWCHACRGNEDKIIGLKTTQVLG